MPDTPKTVFTGRIITLNLEQVELPNGKTTELEIIHHPGGVAVIVEDADGRICLLRQYRYAAGGWIWEIPAGKLESDTDILGNAKREVLEETGVTATQWEQLGKVITSPGIFTEVIHLFYASSLTMDAHNHEEEEVIEVHWLSANEIERMIMSGEICDAKTIIGFYFYRNKNNCV